LAISHRRISSEDTIRYIVQCASSTPILTKSCLLLEWDPPAGSHQCLAQGMSLQQHRWWGFGRTKPIPLRDLIAG
jgi:hypothetical protein